MFSKWPSGVYGTSFPLYRRSILVQGAMSPDDTQALWRACLQITEAERLPGDKVELDVLMAYLEEMEQADFVAFLTLGLSHETRALVRLCIAQSETMETLIERITVDMSGPLSQVYRIYRVMEPEFTKCAPVTELFLCKAPPEEGLGVASHKTLQALVDRLLVDRSWLKPVQWENLDNDIHAALQVLVEKTPSIVRCVPRAVYETIAEIYAKHERHHEDYYVNVYKTQFDGYIPFVKKMILLGFSPPCHSSSDENCSLVRLINIYSDYMRFEKPRACVDQDFFFISQALLEHGCDPNAKQCRKIFTINHTHDVVSSAEYLNFQVKCLMLMRDNGLVLKGSARIKHHHESFLFSMLSLLIDRIEKEPYAMRYRAFMHLCAVLVAESAFTDTDLSPTKNLLGKFLTVCLNPYIWNGKKSVSGVIEFLLYLMRHLNHNHRIVFRVLAENVDQSEEKFAILHKHLREMLPLKVVCARAIRTKLLATAERRRQIKKYHGANRKHQNPATQDRQGELKVITTTSDGFYGHMELMGYSPVCDRTLTSLPIPSSLHDEISGYKHLQTFVSILWNYEDQMT